MNNALRNPGIQLRREIRQITAKIRSCHKRLIPAKDSYKTTSEHNVGARQKISLSRDSSTGRTGVVLKAGPVPISTQPVGGQNRNLIWVTMAGPGIGNVRSTRSKDNWGKASELPACIEMTTATSDSAPCGTRQCIPRPLGHDRTNCKPKIQR